MRHKFYIFNKELFSAFIGYLSCLLNHLSIIFGFEILDLVILLGMNRRLVVMLIGTRPP